MKYTDESAVIDNWQFQHFKKCAEIASAEVFGRDAVLTAGINGKHSDKSLHYIGLAWDLRVWVAEFDSSFGRFENKLCHQFRDRLVDFLGAFYDVVIHYMDNGGVSHIHTEYDERSI